MANQKYAVSGQGTVVMTDKAGNKTPLAFQDIKFENAPSSSMEFQFPREVTITMEDAVIDEELLRELMPKRINDLKEAADYAYGLSETKKELTVLEGVLDDQVSKLKAQIESLEEWYATVSKPLVSKVDYFTLLLSDYHQRTYDSADGDKAKGKVTSIKLPYGVTLSSRSLQPKLEVIDEEALLVYAKASGAVQVTEKPKWADIKKQLTVTESGHVVDSNGEPLPFIAVTPQERKFEVK